jgi:hypothetical protein
VANNFDPFTIKGFDFYVDTEFWTDLQHTWFLNCTLFIVFVEDVLLLRCFKFKKFKFHKRGKNIKETLRFIVAKRWWRGKEHKTG